MAKPPCQGISVAGPIPVVLQSGPGSKYDVSPAGFVGDHECTVKITFNGEEIKGAGTYSGYNISTFTPLGSRGYSSITIYPPPNKPGQLVFEVDCPNCESTISLSIGPRPLPPQTGDGVQRAIVLIGFGVLGGLVGALFGFLVFQNPLGAVAGFFLGFLTGFVGPPLIGKIWEWLVS